jgi:hypothetical protein
LRCLADSAIGSALSRRARGSGTDVAGAIATAVGRGRAAVRAVGAVVVTVLTDGCQAPAASGPNRDLTDLCGLLEHGVSVARILREHAAEFDLGNAHGVSLRIEGLGVGRFANRATTARSRALARFWLSVCLRADASCQVGVGMP